MFKLKCRKQNIEGMEEIPKEMRPDYRKRNENITGEKVKIQKEIVEEVKEGMKVREEKGKEAKGHQ